MGMEGFGQSDGLWMAWDGATEYEEARVRIWCNDQMLNDDEEGTGSSVKVVILKGI